MLDSGHNDDHPAALVFAVVTTTHAWAIKDLWLDHTSTVSAGQGVPLRAVSANVLVSNETPAQVLELARMADADLLVLVEAEGERWHGLLAALAQQYPQRAPADWQDGAPVLLFSRHPLLSQRVVRPTGGRRRYLEVQISVEERALTAIGVHPASPSPQDPQDTHLRNRQLDHIAASVARADRPTVVAGDFNTTPWSPHFRDLLAATGLHNAANGHGWIATFPRQFWSARIPIDHILIKGPIGVSRIERGPSIGSDHFPVIADLRLLP